MAISVISVSSDSSEDSVGTPDGRVILFGTIPTTIPDATPVITPPTTQTDTTTESDPSEDPSSCHIPPLPAVSPFLSSDDDTTDSPVWGCDRLVSRAKVIENQVMAISVISISSDSSEDSMGTPAGRVILLGTIPTTIPDTTPVIAPPTTETPIIAPTTPSSPTHDIPFIEITASTQRSPVIPRRRVMILAPGQPIPHGRPYHYHPNGPVHMMTARKRVRPLPVQHLSVRHSVDCSSSDPLSRHLSSDHSSSDLSSTSAGLSRKRRRSSMKSVPELPHVSKALSLVYADLIPSPKRVRDIGYLADVEVGLRETRVERVTHPAMPEDIPEPAQEGAAEVTYETLGDLVQRFHDHTQAISVHRIHAIEGVQREQGHRIVGVESAVTALTERVAELERDNRRLRGTTSVESQRVRIEEMRMDETEEIKMEIMEEMRMEETEEMEMEMEGMEEMEIMA
nr:hypothetical protein [Tanacetum cinerariifolium]